MPYTAPASRTTGHRWGPARLGYLLVPFVGVWFTLAYLVPSPVGLLVPAVPYLALALAGAAALLLYAQARATGGPRWSKVYRNTAVIGAVLGLAVAGGIGLVSGSVLDCPYLPPSSSLVPSYAGWAKVPTGAWAEKGEPVLFFFAASWCPYCSASSWAVWKALSEFGTVSGNYTSYSFGPPEPFPYTPEMVLANVHLSSGAIAVQVSEYSGSVDGQAPVMTNCYQRAYVSTYDSCSNCGIPFLVVDGQWVHRGSLVNPAGLSTWNRTNDPGGAATVERSVGSESGTPWGVVQEQTWWIMALLVKSTGRAVLSLAAEYGWSTSTAQNVTLDLNAVS